MDLVEIDIICAKALERIVQLLQDRLAAEARAILPRTGAVIHLGGKDDLIAIGKVSERPADDLLRGAIRINIGGIKEIDSGVERLADSNTTFLFPHRPWMRAAIRLAIGHAAQRKPRDLEPCLAQVGYISLSTLHCIEGHPHCEGL